MKNRFSMIEFRVKNFIKKNKWFKIISPKSYRIHARIIKVRKTKEQYVAWLKRKAENEEQR